MLNLIITEEVDNLVFEVFSNGINLRERVEIENTFINGLTTYHGILDSYGLEMFDEIEHYLYESGGNLVKRTLIK
jgi:hypothetical protein